MSHFLRTIDKNQQVEQARQNELQRLDIREKELQLQQRELQRYRHELRQMSHHSELDSDEDEENSVLWGEEQERLREEEFQAEENEEKERERDYLKELAKSKHQFKMHAKSQKYR